MLDETPPIVLWCVLNAVGILSRAYAKVSVDADGFRVWILISFLRQTLPVIQHFQLLLSPSGQSGDWVRGSPKTIIVNNA